MSSPDQKRKHVFISYSRKDAKWLERLRVHLRPLEREHRIEIWDDTNIVPGSKWRDEIKKALALTKIAILLVSADFLASDFITTDELPPLLAAAEQDGAIILPVILSPSRFQRTTLAAFHAVNNPAKPMITMNKGEQEAVLVKVAELVESAFDSLPSPQARIVAADPGEKGERQERESRSNSSLPVLPATDALRSERKTSWPLKLSPTMWLALVGLVIIATFSLYLLFRHKDQNRELLQFIGRVTDAVTHEPVRNATVTIEASPATETALTDSEGIFRSLLPASTQTVRLRVEAAEYLPAEEVVSVSGTSIQTIALNPNSILKTPTPVPTLTPTPTPIPTASAKPTNRPSPRPCSTYEKLVLGKTDPCWSYVP